MNTEDKPVARITLDLKHDRFRISMPTLYGLGNPIFIQFLINPEALYITLLGADKPVARGMANRIYLRKYHGCAEFYSKSFLVGLLNVFGNLDSQCSYHIFGEIDQVNHLAYLSLRTLKKIERNLSDVGQGI